MAGHLLFNSGSNESSLAPQFKWLDNTFKLLENPLKKVVVVNKIQKISEKNQPSLIACKPSAALGKPEPWPRIFLQTKY